MIAAVPAVRLARIVYSYTGKIGWWARSTTRAVRSVVRAVRLGSAGRVGAGASQSSHARCLTGEATLGWMPRYLISYDLTAPGRNYEALFNELARLGAKRLLLSQWGLRNPATAVAIRRSSLVIHGWERPVAGQQCRRGMGQPKHRPSRSTDVGVLPGLSESDEATAEAEPTAA